jgi:Rps23 Pro-64 3,4-dihydroxylase Tpa1-like proline 4-hydroxylase
MSIINYTVLEQNKEQLKKQWSDPAKPFRYLIFDGVLDINKAKEVIAEYPSVNQGEWNGTTYVHQKNKFSMTKFGNEFPKLQQVFSELNSQEFLGLLSEITNIKDLLGDDDLFGGGLHQSITGAFLNVHVDFNMHETTKFHRRMNAIIFMNENWKDEYNGFLELWDMSKKVQIENIKPVFNRLVIFETNEVSYHGHPKPLASPEGVTRKSLAVYYYTKERPANEIAPEHNTKYVNTEGATGVFKTVKSGIKALKERIFKS